MPARHPHVAVLGAGVCGLAAAWELLRSGTAERVTLLEAEDRPGGLARSVYDPSGLQSDLGPHRIHTELPEIEALLGDLVGPEMVWVERRSAMHVEGRFVPYPLGIRSVVSLFGPVEFLRMGLSAAWAKAHGLWSPAPANFEEHMIRAFGHRVYGRILRPYSAKVWKLDPREISVKAAEVRVSAGSMGKLAKRLLARGRERRGEETALREFRYIQGGVEALVRRLAEKVTGAGGVILCSHPVERLTLEGPDRWLVQHCQGQIESSAVIATIPVTHLSRMLCGDDRARPPETAVEALRFLSIDLVFVKIRRPRVSKNHWLYFPDESIIFNRGYEPSRFWAGPGKPTGSTLLCLEITARPDTPMHGIAEADLAAQVEADLLRTGLVRREEIEKSFVVRLPFGYPLYDCHADGHLRTVFDHLRAWPNLVTTGRQGLFSHNNMDHSMFMGLEAARALARGPEGAAAWYGRADALRHFRIVD